MTFDLCVLAAILLAIGGNWLLDRILHGRPGNFRNPETGRIEPRK